MEHTDPTDALADTPAEQSESPPAFDDVVTYETDSHVILCDRSNPAAWIAVDVADATAATEMR